jgi:hypothetical protein
VDCISMLVIEEKISNWKWKYPLYVLNAAEAAQTTDQAEATEAAS